LNIEIKINKKIVNSCIIKTKKDEPIEKFVVKKDFIGFEKVHSLQLLVHIYANFEEVIVHLKRATDRHFFTNRSVHE